MIIINFIYVFAFAMLGEILRANYFSFGKLLKKTPSFIPNMKKETKPDKKVENEEKSEKSEKVDDQARFDTAKSEKVKELLKKNHIFE